MPKQKNDPKISENDDGSLDVELTPSRRIVGDDTDPTDAETGEALFADISPRFRTALAKDAPEEEPEEDEHEAEEDDEDEPEETPEVDDEPEEDDEPAEGSSRRKSSKVAARVARERRLREEAEANNRDLKARLDRLEAQQQTVADDAKFLAEQAEAQKQLIELQKQKAQAVEDGDTAAQIKIDDQILDLKVDLKAKKLAHEAAKTQRAAAQADPAQHAVVVRKANAWIRKHPRFRNDSDFKDLVKRYDREIAKEGFDPETDEFYEELDRRVKKVYPEEYPQPTRTQRNKHPSQNQRPAAKQPSKTAGDLKAKDGKVRLTQSQVANMRKFGMDPSNPNHVLAYVQNNRK